MTKITDNGCRLCPRNCGVLRSDGRYGYCGSDDVTAASRAALHMWEEPCISGSRGSGAVFFTGCNLHCCFCQNHVISGGGTGKKISTERLSEIFLELQDKKANNINLVTPTHYSDKIAEAVVKAKKNGLSIPVVYNCGGYESVDTVTMLGDCVDVWMPDMKYMSSELAARYSNAPDYFERASAALAVMAAQVEKKGGLNFVDEDKMPNVSASDTVGINADTGEKFSIMTRGVLVRHMTLPGAVADSKRILRYLHNTYGNSIYISIMSQYTPMPHILNGDGYPELKRPVSAGEYDRLVSFAEKIGIENAFVQGGEVAKESFIPEFDGLGI